MSEKRKSLVPVLGEQNSEQAKAATSSHLTPIASTIETTPSENKYDEISKLRMELASRKFEVDNLRDKMILLTTLKKELELNQEALHGKFYDSARRAMAKESELNSLDSQLDDELENLKKTLELHKKELQLNHESHLHQLNRSFEDKVEQTLQQKLKYVSDQKHQLNKEIQSQISRVNSIRTAAKKSKERILEKYDTKLKEVSDMIMSAKLTLDQEFEVVSIDINEKTKVLKEVETNLLQLRTGNTTLNKNLNDLRHKANDLTTKRTKYELQITNLTENSHSLNQQITNLEAQIQTLKRRTLEATDDFEIEERKRRFLNNILQDLKGNIRVFCRVRPPLSHESSGEVIPMSFPQNIGQENQEQVILQDPKTSERLSSKTALKKHNFKFDKVFDMNSTNADIFDEISPLVQSCINGYNICLFTYGQTGSGKTYTMSETEIGMIPRTVHQIFDEITKLSNLKNYPWQYQITGKFLEIYNENIIDLISDSYNPSRKHEIRHDVANSKTTVTGLTEVVLQNADQVTEILEKANKSRSTASTKANERSSRSHSIFILQIKGQNKITNETCEGTLNLIDLAGSERLSNSQALGERLKETQSINKSLSALGDVISALATQNLHVPFRNSKLTYLLQFSLTGNSKTLMFVNVSPMAVHFNETVNSLRFAMKVNNTKIN